MEIRPNENTGILLYANLLSDIKIRIRQAQVKETLSANAEMIMMYWDVGRMIHERQQQEGWSASIIPRLSRDLRNELPEVKGFSERTLGVCLLFFAIIKISNHFCHSLWQKVKFCTSPWQNYHQQI